ncbi:MAG TPA: SprT family zinc-dependent metalloprotease [Candidatus Saccharimonadales bacterium]|nr:SprT family zinc-dependent metalloprotease [Candidatus Saccharimonadales bacterium]
MAFKQFQLDDSTVVTVYKRRSNRNLKLSITPNGEVRVSIPLWAPYKAGVEFARSKQSWIQNKRPIGGVLQDGQAIGKAHRLKFVAGQDRITTRIRQNEVVVGYPDSLSYDSPEVQAAAQKAGIRALRRQAEALLPQRLEVLASKHGLTFKSVTVKQMKGRWGSCDHQKNIVLNLFLMQMPWDCIDYVLLHELTHTQVLRHGPDFWKVLEGMLPDAKSYRRTMRSYQPILRNEPQLVA